MPQDTTAQNIPIWLLLGTIAPYRHPLRTADPASLEPGLPGRAATLGDRPLAAGRKFHGVDALYHGPYSLHTRYRPCGGDSRLVPPTAGQPLALAIRTCRHTP